MGSTIKNNVIIAVLSKEQRKIATVSTAIAVIVYLHQKWHPIYEKL
jgi:pyridoxal biosynthesis lyase PdxS